MTIIELMVSLLVGSLLVIAVFIVMSTFEGRRRTIGSGADLDQSGSVAMYQIDQWVRSAGSGLSQGYTSSTAGIGPYAFGCPLYAATTAAGQILPAPSPLPAPFNTVNPGSAGVFRLAPALILPGQTAPGASVAGMPSATSDVLVLMASGNNLAQVPSVFSATAAATQLNLVNTIAFAPLDLVLLLDQQGAAGGLLAPCMVTQVASNVTASTVASPVTALPLGGGSASWYAATIGTAAVTNYSSSGVAMDLGNPSPGGAAVTRSPPSFQLVGVGNNDTLFSYDLLNVAGSAGQVQARAQNVFELHALYGVQAAAGTGSGCVVDTWVNPTTTTTFTLAALSAGTPAAASLIKRICALRVGLILRAALPERTTVKETPTLTLFANFPPESPDPALLHTRALASGEQIYRYRTVEATIPVRNNNF